MPTLGDKVKAIKKGTTVTAQPANWTADVAHAQRMQKLDTAIKSLIAKKGK